MHQKKNKTTWTIQSMERKYHGTYSYFQLNASSTKTSSIEKRAFAATSFYESLEGNNKKWVREKQRKNNKY